MMEGGGGLVISDVLFIPSRWRGRHSFTAFVPNIPERSEENGGGGREAGGGTAVEHHSVKYDSTRTSGLCWPLAVLEKRMSGRHSRVGVSWCTRISRT